MRVATWNLERGRTRRAVELQADVLNTVAADVAVLTEPPSRYCSGIGVVTSPPARHGRNGMESWVAIVGAGITAVDLDIPFERMAVAARLVTAQRSMIFYGSVLPWNAIRSHAPELVHGGEAATAVFMRLLREQLQDIGDLRRRFEHDEIVWAGDFNQTVTGPNRSGSHAKRRALVDALKSARLEAWNGDAAHAKDGLCAVDLICGAPSERPTRLGRIEPVRDRVVMSDHAGYWVDLVSHGGSVE